MNRIFLLGQKSLPSYRTREIINHSRMSKTLLKTILQLMLKESIIMSRKIFISRIHIVNVPRMRMTQES